MRDPLRREVFEPLLDTELPLQIGATPVQARLVEVRGLQSPTPRRARRRRSRCRSSCPATCLPRRARTA